MTETGYDLAVLMRPAGEARFANVRKLTRLAAEFEAREGRDLRGLLDFLAARAESDAEAQAATAAEGHDGVRIMTVHNAKGLEFDVVAVPDLSRSLLAGARPPLLALGRERPPRVGMQLRRLGSAAVNLYEYAELCEEAKRARLRRGPAALPRRRHAGPRAADPQRRRQARAGQGDEAGHAGRSSAWSRRFGVERDADATVTVPPPEPRAGPGGELRAGRDRGPRQPALARARRASCAAPRREAAGERDARRGPAAAGRAPPAGRPQPPPLLHRDLRLRGVPLPLLHGARARPRPLRAQFFPHSGNNCDPDAEPASGALGARGAQRPRRRRARAAGVEPGERVARAARGAGPAPRGRGRARPRRRRADDLLAPVRGWLGSPLLRERVARRGAAVRAEVPILLGVGGTVLRGSIDLLVERDGAPPLVVDYKTDRLGGADPAEHAARYEIQRSIYALAAAEALGAERGRGRLRLPRAPRGAGARPPRPGRDGGRPRPAWRPTIARIAPASSRSPRPSSATGTSAAAARPSGRLCSGPDRVAQARRLAPRRSSFAASSSSFSSFSPSPTASSSAAQ